MKIKNLSVITTLAFIFALAFTFSIKLRPHGFIGGGMIPSAQAQHQHGGPPMEESQAPTQPQVSEEPQAQEAPQIEIPLEKQQLIGVKTTEVMVKPLEKVIRTVGRIEYDERKLATVNTKFEGWIEKLYVDYTGKYVKKGQPLAEFYSPELFATQQEFINLVRWSKKQKNDFRSGMLTKDADVIVEAAKQRLKLWDITEEQIKKVEETAAPIRTLTIYSPVGGYIIQKMVVQGTRVMPGEKLFDVADLSTVWVIADIYEYELPLVKVGEKARISLSYSGKEFSSTIEYVYPTLAGETRTAKVRFSIPNPGGHLMPQMYTNVEIKIALGTKLAIPEDALIDTGERQIVYVAKGEGYFEPREVVTGVKAENLVEVLQGLTAGERVASAANFLIDSEAKLKGVQPLGGPQHQH